MKTKDITIIIGPTGIGKSNLAIQKAKELNGEIISADAFQVYKGMDIGTAKIMPDERENIPHHLIDIRNPDEAYDITQFMSLTNALITQIKTKNKHPIICGGTGLYINAFLYKYQFPPVGENPSIRAKWETLGKENGPDWLWRCLNTIDPDIATNIPYQNTRRVIRALEIYDITQKRPSTLQTKAPKMRSDTTIIGLTANRSTIHSRINTRVDTMFKKGLIVEVETLLKSYSPSCKAFEALGYKETIQHLENTVTKDVLIETIKMKTRQFSKRQMTWFKRIPKVEWLEIEPTSP